MENHSFDNVLGMLPHQVSARRNVDGLPVDARGRPTPVNRANGRAFRARPAPTPCQERGHPGQNWNASHLSYAGGRNSGFVRASGPVAMWFRTRPCPATPRARRAAWPAWASRSRAGSRPAAGSGDGQASAAWAFSRSSVAITTLTPPKVV
jgi:hypothetical protein